jgi:tetraacyldisaccharide 4'-kinase
MNWNKNIESILNDNRPVRPVSFRGALAGLALIYSRGVRLRNMLYQFNILKKDQLSCPVISIGNITLGGTGKTPMAEYLARILKKMDRKPAVLSRGYKGAASRRGGIVTDGSKLLMDMKDAGDEPYMMARKLEFPVVIGRRRRRSGRLAIKTLSADVIVLDDGYQHLQLERNLNILLMDYEHPVGNGMTLPAGMLREPYNKAVERADAIVFTRVPETVSENNQIAENKPVSENQIVKWITSSKEDCPVFYSRHKTVLISHHRSEIDPVEPIRKLEQIKGKTATVFSGLAKNRLFYKTVVDIGVDVLDQLAFRDHHEYGSDDVELINQKALASRSDLIITTEKDWVKLHNRFEWAIDVVVLGVEIALDDPETFDDLIKRAVN